MCGALADAYEAGARAGGHEVQRLNLGDMQFDPILHQGYRAIQQMEPDLQKFQDLLKWSDHFVIVHPVWWLGMPALLKGLFDRAWLPGSEFRYIKTKAGKRTIFWHRLMRGKTARLIVTSGTSPWLERLFPGNVNSQLKWGFSGSPVFPYAPNGSDRQKMFLKTGKRNGSGRSRSSVSGGSKLMSDVQKYGIKPDFPLVLPECLYLSVS